jgi:hypothetical protein
MGHRQLLYLHMSPARFHPPLLQVMDKLDEPRKKKIEEMVAEAISAGRGGSGPATAAARPPARTASGASGGGASGSRPGTARSSPKALAPKNLNRPAAAGKAGAAPPRRTASGGGAAAAAKTRSGGGGGGAPAEEDLSSGKLSNEELEERMCDTFGALTGEGQC